MNDRRTTERMLHAKLMLIVVSEGVDHEKYPVAQKVQDLLMQDLKITADKAGEQRGFKLLDRSSRTMRAIRAEHIKHDGLVSKFGLTVFYMLRHLADIGYTSFEGGDPFNLALETILPALGEETVHVKLDQSAQKQARHLFNTLQREGYYKGATWSDA